LQQSNYQAFTKRKLEEEVPLHILWYIYFERWCWTASKGYFARGKKMENLKGINKSDFACWSLGKALEKGKKIWVVLKEVISLGPGKLLETSRQLQQHW